MYSRMECILSNVQSILRGQRVANIGEASYVSAALTALTDTSRIAGRFHVLRHLRDSPCQISLALLIASKNCDSVGDRRKFLESVVLAMSLYASLWVEGVCHGLEIHIEWSSGRA